MYINTTDSNSTLRALSESQGYGMVFTALVGKQSDYDKLLLFFQNHQYSNTGLMSWEIDMNSNSALDNNATDGDLWIAYSLFRAYDRWNDKNI
uniref:Glyco_hydro_8 n=1 Tax=uncultured Streptococcus sp. TaxID=83427 RepID=A0A060C9G6_9STRE|nr:Glyco_hydro_8 [uncultured Streptococcus sp.]